MHFPDQLIDWGYLLNKFSLPSHDSFGGRLLFQERMQFLVICGMSTRVEALPLRVWRDCIFNMIHTATFQWNCDNSVILREI